MNFKFRDDVRVGFELDLDLPGLPAVPGRIERTSTTNGRRLNPRAISAQARPKRQSDVVTRISERPNTAIRNSEP